jgi:hypothetical protein
MPSFRYEAERRERRRLAEKLLIEIQSENPEYYARTKHISIKHHVIREKIETGEIKLGWVPTREMVADKVTEPLAREPFERLKKMMGMMSLGEFMGNSDLEIVSGRGGVGNEAPQTFLVTRRE